MAVATTSSMIMDTSPFPVHAKEKDLRAEVFDYDTTR